jgi:hypothetical protein
MRFLTDDNDFGRRDTGSLDKELLAPICEEEEEKEG